MPRIPKPSVPKFAQAAIHPSLYVFTLLPTTLPKSFCVDVLEVFNSFASPKAKEPMLEILHRQLKDKDLAIKFKYLWEEGIRDYTRTVGGAQGILASGDDYQISSFVMNFLQQRREIHVRVSTAGTIVQEIRIDKPIDKNEHALENLFQSILKHSWITIKDKLMETQDLGFISSLLKKREFFPIGYSTKGPKEAFENAISAFIPMISKTLEMTKNENDPQGILVLKSIVRIYSQRIHEVALEMDMAISPEILRQWDSRKFEIEYEAENSASSTLRNIEQALERISSELDESLE